MTFSRLALLAASLLTLALPATADARPRRAEASGIPPFCVTVPGPRGMPLPQICRFYDYQQCLLASAQTHGNCVVNIDYPGKITSAPGATWSR